MTALGLVLLATAGCGANHNSIFRQRPIGATATLTMIDAKQRAIISTRDPSGAAVPGTAADRQRVCSEPAPDAFSVLAQSLAAGVEANRSADPSSLGIAANLAFSSAESGATIARTQTVNLLRELMFRTCERYLSGAIAETEMPKQAMRDQRLIVSTLAIEQLTGAVTPPTVIVRAGGAASSGASGGDAAVRLDDAFKVLQAAQGRSDKARAELGELDAAEPKCAALADDTTTGNSAKKTQCSEARTKAADAKAARDDAKAHYDSLNAAIGAGGIPVGAETTTASDGVDGLAGTGASDIAEVATAVREIVRLNLEQDEFALACATLVGQEESPQCKRLREAKVDEQIVATQLRTQTIRLQMGETAAVVETAASSNFDLFWERVKSDGDSLRADPARLRQVIGALPRVPGRDPMQRRLAGMMVRTDKAGIAEIFRTLPLAPYQLELANSSN